MSEHITLDSCMIKIDCPNCNEKISEKAMFCRFCQYGLSSRNFLTCELCSKSVRIDAKSCRFCHCAMPRNRNLVFTNAVKAFVKPESVNTISSFFAWSAIVPHDLKKRISEDFGPNFYEVSREKVIENLVLEIAKNWKVVDYKRKVSALEPLLKAISVSQEALMSSVKLSRQEYLDVQIRMLACKEIGEVDPKKLENIKREIIRIGITSNEYETFFLAFHDLVERIENSPSNWEFRFAKEIASLQLDKVQINGALDKRMQLKCKRFELFEFALERRFQSNWSELRNSIEASFARLSMPIEEFRDVVSQLQILETTAKSYLETVAVPEPVTIDTDGLDAYKFQDAYFNCWKEETTGEEWTTVISVKRRIYLFDSARVVSHVDFPLNSARFASFGEFESWSTKKLWEHWKNRITSAISVSVRTKAAGWFVVKLCVFKNGSVVATEDDYMSGEGRFGTPTYKDLPMSEADKATILQYINSLKGAWFLTFPQNGEMECAILFFVISVNVT